MQGNGTGGGNLDAVNILRQQPVLRKTLPDYRDETFAPVCLRPGCARCWVKALAGDHRQINKAFGGAVAHKHPVHIVQIGQATR